MPISIPNPLKKGSNGIDQEVFRYTHKNPYHEKLTRFHHFVLRDEDPEKYRGKWNPEVFGRQAPLCLEIGTGYGHFMLEYTKANPHINFIGLDYRFKRGFQLAKKLSHQWEEKEKDTPSPSTYFRYLRARGERIQWIFGESELDQIFYFFPDPWPKKRHHKKRLFQTPFLEAAYKVLKPGGSLFIKTDHHSYAEWILEHLQAQQFFEIKLKTFDLRQEYSQHYLASFQTKFEKIFLKKNTPIKAFELISSKPQLPKIKDCLS